MTVHGINAEHILRRNALILHQRNRMLVVVYPQDRALAIQLRKHVANDGLASDKLHQIVAEPTGPWSQTSIVGIVKSRDIKFEILPRKGAPATETE